jgi:hypothetical protein
MKANFLNVQRKHLLRSDAHAEQNRTVAVQKLPQHGVEKVTEIV